MIATNIAKVNICSKVPTRVSNDAQSPDITELEYYFDTDPGFGYGTSVPVSPDTVTSTTFNLDISSLDAGIHYAFIRAKDADDVWSFVHKMIIQKVITLPVIPDKDGISEGNIALGLCLAINRNVENSSK